MREREGARSRGRPALRLSARVVNGHAAVHSEDLTLEFAQGAGHVQPRRLDVRALRHLGT